jgi:HD-GYP domain-containing protein (c-di-GMP phosphodiesterase class II)
MNYVPIPIERIAFGKALPVNVWDPKGNLLLRKGQAIRSEQHREALQAHQACAIEADYKAWQRSYDRLIYTLLREGASVETIASASMPDSIADADYAAGHDIHGDWLDVQEVLGVVLSQGAAATHPLERIDAVARRAMQLLDADVDDSLFTLFQALNDVSLGYCATHALLAAVMCELTARRLQVPDYVRPVLFLAALTMNIGMAREQDKLARQSTPPTTAQRQIIRDHAQAGGVILRGFGVANEDWLDLVGQHHALDESLGLARNLECRRILRVADGFVAKIAARATRLGLSALGAAKAALVNASAAQARVGSALATAVSFYPPGTYVALANGEIAVSAQRGAAANTPIVVSAMHADGMPLGHYLMRDTSQSAYAIRAPVGPQRIRLRISAVQVRKALGKTSGHEPAS